MVKITLDHSALTLFDRDPVIRELKRLDEERKITMYHAISLDREIEEISESEGRIYEKLKEMIFGNGNINLTEHADLLLLMKHMKGKRDFFLTLDKKKYDNIAGHKDVNVRIPDSRFLEEIKTRVSLGE